MENSLRSYLTSVSNAGTLDSRGHFTVDIQKKRMKIRQNQLSKPIHYLLCCIRAGVTSGAELIDVEISVGGTRVLLKSVKKIEPRDLLEGILKDDSAGPTEELLGAGIQGGLSVGAERVEIKLSGARLLVTTDSLEVSESGERSGDCELFFSFKQMGLVAGRSRQTQEIEAVKTRCSFSPVPVKVNGVSVVDTFHWESLFQWQASPESYGVHPAFAWIEAYLHHEGDPFPVTPSRRRSRVEYLGGDRHTDSTWQPDQKSAFLRIVPRSNGRRHKIQSLVRLGSRLEGPGRLFLVKQGVVLEEIQEYLGAPGIGVVVRADHLETDFSHFQPIRNHAFQKLLKRTQAQVVALVSQLGEERKNLVIRPTRSVNDMLFKSSVVGTGGAVFGAMVGGWAALLMGGSFFLAAGAFCLVAQNDRVLVEREQALRRELDSYVQQVRPPRLEGKLRL